MPTIERLQAGLLEGRGAMRSFFLKKGIAGPDRFRAPRRELDGGRRDIRGSCQSQTMQLSSPALEFALWRCFEGECAANDMRGRMLLGYRHREV
jgi:hypothetical protein